MSVLHAAAKKAWSAGAVPVSTRSTTAVCSRLLTWSALLELRGGYRVRQSNPRTRQW